MSFNAIRENKILAKISGFTVVISFTVQLDFQSIKDYKLFGMVGVLSGIVIFILAVWEILSPQQVVTRFVQNEVYTNSDPV